MSSQIPPEMPLVAIALEDSAAAAELARLDPHWRVIGPEDGARIDMPISAAFIEWLLPAMSGFELCRRLRDSAAGSAAHITMVLDPADPALRRRALSAGADDYLPGPLTADALRERLAARQGPLRGEPAAETVPSADGPIRAGEFILDPLAVRVRRGPTTIQLSRNEFELLAFFMQHPDEVFSREALVTALGKPAMIGERAVDRRISRLRSSFEACGIDSPVRTVWGLGYVFDTVG